MGLWRTSGWGASGRYTESGLLLLGDTNATYIADALELAKSRGEADNVQEIAGGIEITQACGTGGSSGLRGYLNRKAGWVDAAKCMTFAYEEVKRIDRVETVKGRVNRLTKGSDNQEGVPVITGVVLDDGRIISADLAIIATGSYSPSLLDMQGIVAASAEILAYLDLTSEQAERLRKMPAIINLSKGWFIIPPNGHVLKVARHGLGFSNVVPFKHPMNSDILQTSAPSLTPKTQQRITNEGLHACREALKELIPWLADRDFNRTRICWYTDTVNGDFIIDYHPQYAGLFVATGGSGHAFKFLPVIGEAVVDRIEGKMGRAYEDLWSWPAQRAASDDEVCRRAYGARGGVLN